jgi:tetratricopeptide (TPR) repeat protein
MSPKKQRKKKKKISPGRRKTALGGATLDIAKELHKALRCQESGNLEKADKICKKILKINPNHPDAIHLRGFIAQQTGRHDKAIELISKAIQRNPNNPFYHYNLALPFISQQEWNEAISCYQRALELKPDLIPARVNMGNLLQEQGRMEEAISCYQKALELRPEDPFAYLNMGNALQGQGDFEEAISCYQKALRFRPDLTEAHYDMGNAFKAQGKLSKAISCYEEALRLNPDEFSAVYNMGNTYQDLNKLEKAISCYKKALEIQPGNFRAYNNMGNALQTQGNFREAISSYTKALEIRPSYAEAFYHMARTEKITDQNREEVLRLASQLSDSQLSEDSSVYLSFGLGKIYDDLEQFEKAFEHYRLGNERERSRHEFDPKSYAAYVSRITKTCGAGFLEDKQSWRDDSQMPIFVFGMPRSGTTLVEQILSSHPEVLGGGELDFFLELERKLTLGSQQSSYPEYLELIDQKMASDVANKYLQLITNLSESAEGQTRITDKMPHNFLFLGLMYLLFPSATFIHCQRHPLDTCLSIYFQRFAREHHYAYDLIDIGFSYREYQRLMAHWRDILPTQIFEVTYEAMVGNQEKVSRELIAFCGLEWNSRCLDFYKSERPIFTSSNWQVRQPMYRSSVGRWRNYAQHLRPLMELLADYMPLSSPTDWG